ncbi:hypothetical protein OG21DRAFT_1527487 [Imleria badia]|nr:hypothetical protein OG21DRAFT_1527487 [Imleria badia]
MAAFSHIHIMTPQAYSGSKIWVYIDTPGKGGASQKTLFKAWDMLFMEALELSLPDVPFGVLVMRQGDILYITMIYILKDLTNTCIYSIQPPSENPQGDRGCNATNAKHLSIQHYVIWMVYGLPILAQQATHRKVLMENEQDYKKQDNLEMMPAMHEKDTMAQEIGHEWKAAMCIIDKLTSKAGLKVIDAKSELDEGNWWDSRPTCALKGLLHRLIG